MKSKLIYLGIFSSFLLFTFRSLIFNISSRLIDWLDYPFIVWTIYQNIEKFKTLNFINLFNTDSFYPNKLTLLFSDTLLPQSVVAFPLSFLINNPILVFNIVFILTFFLNFIASFYFWKQIFHKDIYGFIGGLLTTFSPSTHLLLGHFQMLTFWPYFFALYFLLRNDQKHSIKNIVLIGVFLAIQFLASVYLAFFLLFSILMYYFLRFIKRFDKADLKNLILVFGIFLLLDGVSIKGYMDVKKNYQIKRDFGQYVTYSAHISDYFFTTNIKSLIYQTPFFKKWNSFDKHNIGENAVFPGFLLTGLALVGILRLNRNKNKYLIGIEVGGLDDLFFLILGSLGFLFSLGPRVSFNGSYSGIPTVYTLFLKIPFFEVIRSTARWSFLLYFALSYFAIRGLSNISSRTKNKNLILGIVIFLFILEYLPINIKTHKEVYINADYTLLKKVCNKEKKVLLEFPVTHLQAGSNIIEGLNYISKVQMASVYHGCYLVNGYSGYDLPSLSAYHKEIASILREGNPDRLKEYLKNRKIDIMKFNPDRMIKEDRFSYSKIRNNFSNDLLFY